LIGAIEGGDLAAILGTFAGLVISIFWLLLKFVLDTRKQTTETNRVVNNRPASEPTLRALVESIEDKVSTMQTESNDRHMANSRRIDRVSTAVDKQTEKLDRLGDAIAGANVRLDRLEDRNEGDGK